MTTIIILWNDICCNGLFYYLSNYSIFLVVTIVVVSNNRVYHFYLCLEMNTFHFIKHIQYTFLLLLKYRDWLNIVNRMSCQRHLFSLSDPHHSTHHQHMKFTFRRTNPVLLVIIFFNESEFTHYQTWISEHYLCTLNFL